MDPFAALFAHAAPSARTFFTGKLCQTLQFADAGHLHLLKAGALTVMQTGRADLELREPTLLFCPRGLAHIFAVDPERGADLMTIARQLLGKGKPVKSVAAQVGYDSAAAFSRVFSRVTGQAPREFDALGDGSG